MVDETSTTGLPLATDYIPQGEVAYQMADPYIRALQEFLFNQAYAVSSNPLQLKHLQLKLLHLTL